MTKQHFIALADAIREHNRLVNFKTGTGLEHLRDSSFATFAGVQLDTLADFCQSQNRNFNRKRWLDYIAGKSQAEIIPKEEYDPLTTIFDSLID